MRDDDASQYRQVMQEALVELESLHGQLDRLRRAASEPIAVIGMGCRFPLGANSPNAFWTLLRDGVDAVREIPAQRWDVDAFYAADPNLPGKVYCRNAALVDQAMVEQFSPEFFGIAPREAERMDPQQRMLLEVCWEALEDAALPAERIRASRTGVFVGSCTDDYLQLFNNLADPARIEGYTSLGTARCITVGRISYLLGLEGPAIQFDTACSSSLVAVHQACASLRSGECDAALAGGVNLQLSPAWTIGLCKLKALAPDGRSKTFDATADGFGRGEGCGIIVLRRLSDALAAGDPIRAVIRGSAINHDGHSSGLTVPSQVAQERLLRQALQAARLEPHEVDYLEAHGTGTALGDPIEMGALASVFHDRRQPLWVGSVKTNIGHLEAAAGVAGLMKIILALEHEAIPRHLHFHQPNPHIPWSDFPAKIPTEQVPWPRSDRPRLAGVSSFGFSGTNAHVVMQEAPRAGVQAGAQRACHLLAISAKSTASLRELAGRYLERLENDTTLRLPDFCFTAAVGRTPFNHRLAIVADSLSQACQGLRMWLTENKEASGDAMSGVFSGVVDRSVEDKALPAWPQSADVEQLDATVLAQKAAERYVRGLAIDWASFYRGADCRKIHLPTYAFERRRYWLPPSHVATAAMGRSPVHAAHPLLGLRRDTAAAPQSLLFERVLSAHDPAYLADHCLGDTVIVPATAQLEIAVAVGRTLWTNRGIAVGGFAWQLALTLPVGESRVVQILLTLEPTGSRFELFGRCSGDGPEPPTWVRHAAGRVTPTDEGCSVVAIDELRRVCSEAVAVETVYDRIARQGLCYGPSFRLLRRAWRSPGHAIGEVSLPDDLSLPTEGYHFHPAVLDACLHTIAALRETDRPATVAPVSLERFVLLARPGARLWSHAVLRVPTDAASTAGFTVDVDIMDAEGRRIAQFQGLRFQEVDAAGMPDASRRAAPTSQAAAALGRPAPWLEQLRKNPPGNRMRILLGLLCAEVAAVLGWESPDRVSAKKSLFDQGMDSMSSVELQYRLERALGCPLPLTLAFDCPNVQALAAYIIRQLNVETGTTADEDTHQPIPDDVQRLAAMSDEEVKALLVERYRNSPRD